jgi:hypothetical protein
MLTDLSVPAAFLAAQGTRRRRVRLGNETNNNGRPYDKYNYKPILLWVISIKCLARLKICSTYPQCKSAANRDRAEISAISLMPLSKSAQQLGS